MKKQITIKDYPKISKVKIGYYCDTILKKMLDCCFFNGKFPIYRTVDILNYVNLKNPNSIKIAFRGITFSNVEYFKKTLFNPMYNFGTINNDSNIYCSVARVSQIPRFSFNQIERKKQTEEFYKNDFVDYIRHYDLYLDFDCNKPENIIYMIRELEHIIFYIVQYNIKSEIVFSGSRGFKVLIYNNSFTYKQMQKIYRNLMTKLNFDYIDDSGILVPSKLMKMNFSIVYKHSLIPKIVLPLSNKNFDWFIYRVKQKKNFDIFNLDEAFAFELAKDINYNSEFLDTSLETGFSDFVNDMRLLK